MQVLSGHPNILLSLATYNKHLMVASYDGTISVYEPSPSAGAAPGAPPLGGAPCFTYDRGIDGRQEGVFAMCVTVDKQNRSVLLASFNNTASAALFDLNSFFGRGELRNQCTIRTLTHERADMRALLAGPNGYFFTGDDAGTVQVWRWTDGPPAEGP